MGFTSARSALSAFLLVLTVLLPGLSLSSLVAQAAGAGGVPGAVPVSPAGSDPTSGDIRSIYKKPQELLDPVKIASLESELQKPTPNYETVIDGALQQLNLYYGQFVSGKRILDERLHAPTPLDLDPDELRLYSLERTRSVAPSYFLGESPYLYRLHRLLGISLEATEDFAGALVQYRSALRYTHLDTPLPLPQKESDREVIYERMLSGFSDPDRVTQETDPNLRSAAERFRTLMGDYRRERSELEEARKFQSVERAAQARGKPSPIPGGSASALDRVTSELASTVSGMETIRTGPYAGYEANKRSMDADLLWRIAGLIRRAEAENLARADALRQAKEMASGAGGVDNTPLRDFTGYAAYLDLAHRVDPENLKYIAPLAAELRQEGLLDRAAELEESFLLLGKKQGVEPAQLAEHYRRLAMLYNELKNPLKSARSYESYLDLSGTIPASSPPPSLPSSPAASGPPDRSAASAGGSPGASRETEERRAAMLHLGDLYFRTLGDFPAAERIYRSYLKETEGVGIEKLDLREEAEYHTIRYRIYRNLASVDRRMMQTAKEKTDLAHARDAFRAMDDRTNGLEKERVALQQKIDGAKRKLLQKPDDPLQRDYYKMTQVELPDLKEKGSFLRGRLRALNLPALLERQAYLLERERSFPEAMDLYREIIRRGTGEQATRARSNLERVRKTLQDGIVRPLDPPPDFER